MNAYEVIMIVLGILTVVISFGALIEMCIRDRNISDMQERDYGRYV